MDDEVSTRIDEVGWEDSELGMRELGVRDDGLGVEDIDELGAPIDKIGVRVYDEIGVLVDELGVLVWTS